MAEMTAAEAVRTAWKFNQPGLVRFIECQESKAKLMSQQIEHCTALIERHAAEIERLNQTWPNSCDFKDDDGCCLFPGAMTPECHAGACSVINGLKQEIERLNKSLQYEQHRTGRQGTHAEGCYKWGPGHWDCAMQEIAKRGRMLDSLKNLRDIQGQKGNYDQGEYMRGMFNGLEVAVSVFTQTEPQFKEWLEKEAEVKP